MNEVIELVSLPYICQSYFVIRCHDVMMAIRDSSEKFPSPSRRKYLHFVQFKHFEFNNFTIELKFVKNGNCPFTGLFLQMSL